MSTPRSQLPARPSLEQLRKQAKERLAALRAARPDSSLADAQHALAREYGFASWPRLVHHVETVTASDRLGLSVSSPSYRIDAEQGLIEPHAPLGDAEWDGILGVMRERRITGIRAAAITDAAMARLSGLEFVTSIDVSGARALTDDGLLHLARMPQLESLTVGGTVTDRGLAVLRELPSLRRFAMPWAQGVSDLGFANLSACDDLERVDLMGTPSGDGTLAALGGKRALRVLHTGRLVTDAGIEHLHALPAFASPGPPQVELGLMSFLPESHSLLLDGPITDRGLARLSGLDGLVGLGLFQHAHAFTGAGLASLAVLPELRFLACPGPRCDDDAMRSIATLPALRMLLAQGAVATDDGFVALGRSRSLELLWGRDCEALGGRGFAALAEVPTLRGLAVSCRNVDDASLASLGRFPALRELVPMDMTDDGFRHVGACAALERLWCMYCRDTGDEATRRLAGLRLRTYYAGRTRITDRSCEILARMSSLESIELWETTGVTDAGVAALARLPRLERFSVSGAPKVTRRGVAVLPRRVRVDYA